MTRSVPNPYGAAFLDFAGPREEMVCLAGDSTGTNLDAFRGAHPERFFNIGMAEQNMIGVAAGMARAGLVPFVHTFAVFLTRRAFDQITLTIGFTGLPVRLMGGLAGLNPYGVSHQAIDDVALMRAVPTMTIIDFAEATEIRTALPALAAVEGPVYSRFAGLGSDEVPVLFETPFRLGAARVLAKGSDLAVISSASLTLEAMRAVERLQGAGVGVQHLHIATIRPLDEEAVLEAIENTRATIVIENHLTSGGLGSAIAELLTKHDSARPVVRLGVRDTYASGGTVPYLFERFGLDAAAIVQAAGTLLDLDPLAVGS